MFGAFRFFLALLVVIEHLYLTTVFHVGAVAVVSFYMLAGYVMSHSLRRNFSDSPLSAFYYDRFLRVFPLYWVFTGLSILAIAWIGESKLDLAGWRGIGLATLFPLNYWPFTTKLFSVAGNSFPIPPAPSLALELHFYLLCPFLVRNVALRTAAGMISLIVFTLAAFGVFHTYNWGYALLPGTLFIFCTGISLYELRIGLHTKINRAFLGFGLLTLGIILIPLLSKGLISVQHNQEVILGYLLAVVAIHFLGRLAHKSRLDSFLGDLSYPMFLGHFFGFLLVKKIQGSIGIELDGWSRVSLMISAALLVSLAGTSLDRRFQNLRRSSRARKQRARALVHAST
ncbi:MAG: acyltransferase family protein [Bdellovibrionales bacterium]